MEDWKEGERRVIRVFAVAICSVMGSDQHCSRGCSGPKTKSDYVA